MKESYRCWAEIDRSALRHNANAVRQRIGSTEMLAVVKANAYGHGLLGVAQTEGKPIRRAPEESCNPIAAEMAIRVPA